MEIQELAAYLPYKVFCTFKTVFEEKNYLFGKTFERVLMPLDLHYFFGSPKRYEHIKPVLLPLSMLTRDELKLQEFESHIDYLTHENKGVEWTLKAPYNMVEYLISKKYDVFGLIEKGEAIAVTNEFNPYK